MTFNNPPIEEIKEILKTVKHIAIVGMSDKPERASFQVASYLQSHGYKIFPVNPLLKEVLGEKVYPTLQDIHEKVDIAVIFRKPEDIPEVVNQVVAAKIKTIWLQLGIINNDAAEKAQDLGLQVVMDRCIMTDHRSYINLYAIPK